MQFNGVKQSKIQWTDLEIKFIKGKNFFKNWEAENQKVGLKNLERYIKIEKKNLQFNGVKQSKIQWTDLEIKFIKGKNFFKNWEAENQKAGLKNLERYIKIEKKICNFLV